MLSVRAAILAVFLGMVLTATAAAQVPDPNLSTMVLDPQSSNLAGLSTCSLGDADAFEYIKITVLDSGGIPIVGMPASSFFFTVVGGNVSFFSAPFTPATDPVGTIYFSVVANQAIPHPSLGGAPLQISVTISGVLLPSPVQLTCNAFNYDGIGSVGPIDFGRFAGDFGTVHERSDFTWSGGIVDPVDFSKFASHWTH